MSPFTSFAKEYAAYLEDARRRLLFIAVFFVMVFTVTFIAGPLLVKRLIDLLGFEGVSYAVLSPYQLLSTSMDIGFFFAIVLTFPLVLTELYEFLASAFTRRERGRFFLYVLGSVLLFALGFLYGGAILYYAAWAVAGFNASIGLANIWDISTFISQSLLTASLLGILFEYPLILTFLIRSGVLTRQILAAGRRFAIAATVILVALLPPTDGLSLIVMAVPLLGMYELTLLLARERKGQVVPAPLLVRPL